MMYKLHRRCRDCGKTFTADMELGEAWPSTCGQCVVGTSTTTKPIDNKLGIQVTSLAGQRHEIDCLTPSIGDGTGRKRGW